MFDAVVSDLSNRYGLGDRSPELFGLLVGYIFNDRRGGFGGFVEGFREQGHGDLVSSWLGNPAEGRALNAGDVGTVFGQGLLNDWSNRLGTSRAILAAAIAGVLPRIVAELTPGGRLPGTPESLRPVVPQAGSPAAWQPTALRSPNTLPSPPMSNRADEIAAALAAPAGFAADPRVNRQHRGAQQPVKRRGGGWLLSLVVVALIAGGAYYAWWSGLLAPYLKQFNLQ